MNKVKGNLLVAGVLIVPFLAGLAIGGTAFAKTEVEYIEKEVVRYVEVAPAEEEYIPSWTEENAKMLARLVWGEARGISSDMEKAAVIWCVLNRVDAEGYGCGNSIEYVVTFPNQFAGYNADFPVTEELYTLAVDVLTRWDKEKAGEAEAGRVLPREFLFFYGDGEKNHFRTLHNGGEVWDWSLPNPYVS